MSINNLNYTASGEALTENFESCRLIPYQDINGIWTNGYGNTHNVVPGVAITQEQANADLVTNAQWAVSVVNNLVTVVLNQDEFNALVDFVFNCGSGNFESSTLLRDLNNGAFEKVAADFEMWDRASGDVCAGLLRRRVADANEFNGTTT